MGTSIFTRLGIRRILLFWLAVSLGMMTGLVGGLVKECTDCERFGGFGLDPSWETTWRDDDDILPDARDDFLTDSDTTAADKKYHKIKAEIKAEIKADKLSKPAKPPKNKNKKPAPTPTVMSGGRVVDAGVPGKTIPAECKIWGNAFADRPEVPGGIKKFNKRATYHYYAPHYDVGTLACADKFWATPGYGKRWQPVPDQSALLQYPWTAYCLTRPFEQSVCGKCLRITNRRTGASVVVRAVDDGGCSDADGTGIDMDPCGFNAIDTDGQGVRDGNLRIDVTEVEC